MDRSHSYLWFFRFLAPIADFIPAHLVYQALHEFVIDLVEDVESFYCQTGLSGIPETADHRAGDCFRYVSVFTNYHWIRTAKLERNALEIAASDGGHMLSC